jgi:serine/threonine-protein kinase
MATELTDETQFGQSLVDRQLITTEELKKCMHQQREYERAGKRVSLTDVALEMAFITKSQNNRLRNSMADSSIYKPAQRIPGFQMLGKLGAGAMATVFKARQLSLDRIVAIKVLPRKLSDNAEFVDRFYKEGRAAARLNHNNIVQAIDVNEAGGYHYFVMEYVEGHTVSDELSEGRGFTEADALDIVIQIAKALDHAHERGFIHRDVKPKNIMLTPDRVAKLADMGLAREARDVESAVSEAGRAYGTPYYISPEQIRGEVDIDFRADIYSLGATFFNMVTGRVPFEGPTPSSVMHKHLKEPLKPPDHINRSLTAGTAEVIEVMMAKNREDRYASTKNLLIDLEAIKRGEPPLQAREKFNPKVLEQLAVGERHHSVEETVRSQQPESTASWLPVLLGVLLVVSVLLNVILIVMMSSS